VKKRQHRNTNNGGAQSRGPPKAGLLLVLRLVDVSRF
jgi:hypothetical protein